MTIKDKLDYIIDKSGIEVQIINDGEYIMWSDLISHLHSEIHRLGLNENIHYLLDKSLSSSGSNEEILWINLFYKIMKKHETIHES